MREIDREGRRCRDRSDDWESRGKCLLHNFERSAAADEKNVSFQRDHPIEKCAADRLVDRIMPADVFPHDFCVAAQIENPGGVNPPGARKVALMFLQKRRKRNQYLGLDANVWR